MIKELTESIKMYETLHNIKTKWRVSIPGITDKLENREEVEHTMATSAEKAVANVVTKAVNIVSGRANYVNGKFTISLAPQYRGVIINKLLAQPQFMHIDELGEVHPETNFKYTSMIQLPRNVRAQDGRVMGEGTEVNMASQNDRGEPDVRIFLQDTKDKTLTAVLLFDNEESARESGFDV